MQCTLACLKGVWGALPHARCAEPTAAGLGGRQDGTGAKDEKREKLGSGGFGRRCCLTARPAGQVVLQIA